MDTIVISKEYYAALKSHVYHSIINPANEGILYDAWSLKEKFNMQFDFPEYTTSMLHDILKKGRHEHFETGMYSFMGARLTMLVLLYGENPLNDMLQFVLEPSLTNSIDQMCRVLGHMTDKATHEQRRSVIEYVLLHHPDITVKDSAALGLASLDDPASIPILERVIRETTLNGFKEDLQQVLNQLIETQKENI